MKYITFTNKGSLDICKNMLISARNVGIEEDITVYVLDSHSEEELSKDFNCKLKFFDSDVDDVYHLYGSKEFKSLMLTKIQIILQELELEEKFLYIDCDVVFKSNPEELLLLSGDMTKNSANVFFASDSLNYHSNEAGRMIWPSPEEVCAGVMYINNIKGTKDFFNKVYEMSRIALNDSSPDSCDQMIIRNILTNNIMPDLTYGVYPLSFITNGHHYFSEKNTTGSEVIIHCNFRIGTNEKITNMKETGIWYLPETVEV